MANAEIIKEFLVSLGFKVDKKGLGDFTTSVNDASQAIETLVKTVAGAAFALGATVTVFAHSLDSVYFASKRINENASDIQAFGKTAKNFGVDAGEATANLEAFAAKLRNQPGFEGWLQSLGITTRNNGVLRDTADLMVDMGRALEKYEPYQRKLFADQAGMSEKMLLALVDPQFKGEFNRQQGLVGNIDAAAEVTRKFNAIIQDLETSIQKALLPALTSLSKAMGDDMEKASKWFVENGDKATSVVNTFTEAIINAGRIILPILGTIADGWKNIFDWTKAAGEKINEIIPSSWGEKIGEGTNWLFEKLGIADAVYDMTTGSKTSSTPTDKILDKPKTTTQSDKQSYLNTLDKRYGLPEGTLYRVWMAESGGGKRMISPAGAEGHFQFMPETAKQYGLKNPYDFEESADAAARYYSDMYKKYGSLQKAAAAYNWGPGNVDRYGLGRAPAETRNYVEKVAGSGVQISQTNNITVSGVKDPNEAARETGRAVDQSNADLVRNYNMAVR